MHADTTRMVTNCSTHNQVLWKRFKRQSLLQVFVELGILFMIIFSYFPMFGIIMAFKDYRIASAQGIFISWVGFKYLSEFVYDCRFIDFVRNRLHP